MTAVIPLSQVSQQKYLSSKANKEVTVSEEPIAQKKQTHRIEGPYIEASHLAQGKKACWLYAYWGGQGDGLDKGQHLPSIDVIV